jgi:hypothetical protein
MSINTLKQQVTELKTRVNPERKRVIVIWAFSFGNEAHGVYGHHGLMLETGQPSQNIAMPIEWELENVTKAYREGTDSWQNPKTFTGANSYASEKEFRSLYPTLESYLEMRRCKCGKHGVDGKQPFNGELKE